MLEGLKLTAFLTLVLLKHLNISMAMTVSSFKIQSLGTEEQPVPETNPYGHIPGKQ